MAPVDGTGIDRPDLSWVVLIEDQALLAPTLDAIAGEDPDLERTEVVVVDASGAGPDLIAETLAAHGAGRARRSVRRLTIDPSHCGEGRAIGLAAARAANTVVVDPVVPVAPGLLAVLLDGTEPAADLDLAGRLDLLRGLLALAAGDPATLARRDDVQAAQLAWIRQLVDEDPAQHAAVVSAARARRVRDLPWSEINRGRARDLAILYAFVPFIDTSGMVAARRVREAGVITDVISQDIGNLRRSDPESLRIPAEVLDELRILPGKRDPVKWRAIRRFTRAALAEVEDLQSAKGPYRSVYSRAMLHHSHFAAALLKLRQPAIRWVAEFSDPLEFNGYGERRVADIEDDWIVEELTAGFRDHGFEVPSTRASFAWAELVAYAFADEIIFTNDHQRDLMIGYCEDADLARRAAGIARVLHHPVPGPDLYEMAVPTYPLDPSRVHIGFFGNFYANRGMGEVLDALALLAPEDRARIELHVFTGHPKARAAMIVERGLDDVIRVNPMLGYLEYLNLSTRFDVLLINDFATSPHFVPNPYLPAKLADYLGSGVRIWSLYEPGSVLSTTEVEFSSELDDAVGAAAVLRRIAALGAVTRAG